MAGDITNTVNIGQLAGSMSGLVLDVYDHNLLPQPNRQNAACVNEPLIVDER